MSDAWVRWSLALVLPVASCTIDNADYQQDSSTDSATEGATSASTSESSSATAGTNDDMMSGEGTGSESVGESSDLWCDDPGGGGFDALIDEEIEQMYCNKLLDMTCLMTVLPDGRADLDVCVSNEEDLPINMTLELRPDGLDPQSFAEQGPVDLRILYANNGCRPRFVEIERLSATSERTLVFAGGTAMPSAAEIQLVELDLDHNDDYECECQSDEPTCCDREPGSYTLQAEIEGVPFEVTQDQYSQTQMIGERRYEVANLRAFRGPECGERIELEWFARMVTE